MIKPKRGADRHGLARIAEVESGLDQGQARWPDLGQPRHRGGGSGEGE